MALAPDPRPLTAEEYGRLPEEDGVRHELAAGLLVSEPVPLPRHGQLEVRLARLLADFADAAGLGVVLTEAGFLLSRNPDTVRGPDVAFVRRDRFDPERRSVAVYRSLLDRERREEGDTLDGGEALPGLTIPLADLFRP